MAAIPLNTFKTTTFSLTSIPTIVYTAPFNVTTVVLLAQVSNIDRANIISVSANYFDGSNSTNIINGTLIPTNDAGSLLTGKLVIQSGCSFVASANTFNQSGLSVSGSAPLLLSILETANA